VNGEFLFDILKKRGENGRGELFQEEGGEQVGGGKVWGKEQTQRISQEDVGVWVKKEGEKPC